MTGELSLDFLEENPDIEKASEVCSQVGWVLSFDCMYCCGMCSLDKWIFPGRFQISRVGMCLCGCGLILAWPDVQPD